MVWKHQYTKVSEFVLCCKDGAYYLAIYLFDSQHLFMNVTLVSSLIRASMCINTISWVSNALRAYWLLLA